MNDTLAPADELAALKADNARLTAENERLKSLVRVLVDDNPDGIVIADPEYKLTFNPAGRSILGAAASQHTPGEFTKNYGLRTADNKPHPPDTLPLVRAKRGEIVENALLYAVTPEAPDGVWLSTSARPLSSGGAIVVFRDITERRKLEMDLAARNEDLAAREAEKSVLVDRLRAAVDELSTPVLEVWDDVLALPVVGLVDTQRSTQMVEKLLAEVVEKRCKYVIVDLTGVDVVDTATADRFHKMSQAVQLLGATCVLTGIQPAVAQTLVGLGIDFKGMATMRNLKRALEWSMARARKEKRGSRDRRSLTARAT